MLHKAIGRILKLGTLISTWGLVTTVLLQIFFRFSPFQTPSWTEEASRLFFIYAISFAAGLAMRTSYYVSLDMFFERLPHSWQSVLNKIIPVVNFSLFAVMAVFAVKFILLGIPEKSPSMGFNMGVAFFSMFVMSVSICYYLGVQIKKIFKTKTP